MSASRENKREMKKAGRERKKIEKNKDRISRFKWIWVWDFDKEEEWLNTMAASGWTLYKVGLCMYYFERTEPDEYTVRLEMHDRDDAYISFLEETGAEYIGRVMKWIYFRRKSELGSFELFSDIDSRIAHLGRIAALLRVLGCVNIMLGVFNSIGYNSRIAWLNLVVGCLLMYGLGRITGKKDSLERERNLRE